MTKIGDLMENLGFKKDVPESTVKAFINNLSKDIKEKQMSLFDSNIHNKEIIYGNGIRKNSRNTH